MRSDFSLPLKNQEKYIEELRFRVNSILRKYLFAARDGLPLSSDLHQAMQYSLLDNGGNRWRPLLVYCTSLALECSLMQSDQAAAAVECIHAYSLVHDDLPAMDDDDFRRSQPSCHRAYDEATAILAGDCLSNLAFEIICDDSLISKNHSNADSSVIDTDLINKHMQLVRVLSKAAGSQGMAYGQALDLAVVKDKQLEIIDDVKQKVSYIEAIHRYKTGCLFAAAMEMAAISCNIQSLAIRQRYYELGMEIGMCYQLQDDLDDISSDQDSVNLVNATTPGFIKEKLDSYKKNIKRLLGDIFPSESNMIYLAPLLETMLKIRW